MNRKEAAELSPIIQAFAEGRDIEYRTKGFNENWKKVTQIPELSFKSFEYRIKPEPKYRPFANAEECWKEMLKHQPFGWIKSKDDSTISKFMLINCLRNNEASITSGIDFTYSELLECYTFIDGAPFGVKKEK